MRSDSKGGIYERELLASLLGLRLVICFAKRTSIILFVDNHEDHEALIPGIVESDLSTRICAVFWALAASAGADVWVEYAHPIGIEYCRLLPDGTQRP